MRNERKTASGAPLRWMRRRRIASGGFLAESRCGRYRLYDYFDGSHGVATLPYWRPIERTSGRTAQAIPDAPRGRSGGREAPQKGRWHTTLVTQTCARCGELFKVEKDLLGNADSSTCVPCLTRCPSVIENEPRRQRVPFSGMDCLPGQLDLFKTDGGIE